MGNIQDAFPSKYLKASDLQQREIVATIDRVDYESVGQGAKQERKPVLYFMNKEKGLVLNKTNANKITELLSTGITEEWHGRQIRLYPTETQFAGETVDCIRIKAAVLAKRNGTRPAPPPPPPVHEPGDDDIEPDPDADVPF